jgi:hypothetical protein
MANTRITQGVIKPNEDYDVRHINATGIITATNLNLTGVLTYEDVTNVDSIGVITARKGIVSSGVVTATAFHGDGSQLTGIDATALKDDGGNVKIQAQDSGAVHTGISTFDTIKVGSGVTIESNGQATFTGIVTFGSSSTTIDGDGNIIKVGTALTLGHTQGLQFHTQNLHSAGFEINQINASGIITASEFRGSGANLSNLPAGLGTALSQDQSSPLNKFYYTNSTLGVDSTITVDPPASSGKAYTQYGEIKVDDSADLIIAEGDDVIPDVLGLAEFGTVGGGPSAGRMRVNTITNTAANGAPTVSNGLVISGMTTTSDISVGSSVTAATFFGDGSGLIGVASTDNIVTGTAATFNTYPVDINAGMDVTGITTHNDDIYLKDNKYLRMGDGLDFALYHTGGAHKIVGGATGNIHIQAPETHILNTAGTAFQIKSTDNSVELYYGTNKKFETLSDGVNITGTLKVNGSAFSSSTDKIEEGNSYAEVLDTGTNGIFRFLAENNEVFRITTDGKIGLGQTANSFPTSRFEIRENAVGFTTSLLITNLNPTSQNNLNIVFAGANNVPTASIGGWAHADATSTANEKGDLFFRTKNAGAFKEHMRINHQGKMIYACNHDQSDRFNDNYSGNNSRNVFNSVTHHKRYVGFNNPTWYEYKTTSGSSGRPQLVYFTVYWSTGHASGFGYYNFHVLGRNPHNTSTLTIERARRGDYGSWGGQYYSWSSSPDITVYTSTKSNSDAGFFIRSQGHISANSGTWDGNCVQQWKIEAYDNQFAGVDNGIFTFAGHSTPSGVGGSVGWG